MRGRFIIIYLFIYILGVSLLNVWNWKAYLHKIVHDRNPLRS